MVSRSKAVKQYKRSKSKWKKELKVLKKQKKMLFSISKKPGSPHEIKKIKKIWAKASKN